MIDNSKYKPAPEELANNVRLATGLQGDVWLVDCVDDMPGAGTHQWVRTTDGSTTFAPASALTNRAEWVTVSDSALISRSHWDVRQEGGYSVGIVTFVPSAIFGEGAFEAGKACLDQGLWGYRYHDSAFYVLPRPTVTFDERMRPHRDDGPAVIWPAGMMEYWLHGIRVPDNAFESEENLRIEALTNNNAEVRRVLTEKYGMDRLMAHHGKVVHEDETGKLWRLERGNTQAAMVEVKNSTPEPDGSRRTYMLRVPPTIRTARGAVAWTFGMEASDYKPELET